MVTFLKQVEQVMKKKFFRVLEKFSRFFRKNEIFFLHNLLNLFQKVYHWIPRQILHFLEGTLFEI